jgi:hypothetical protein
MSTDILAAYEKRVLNFCEFRQDNNDLLPPNVASESNDQSEGLTSSGNETKAFNELREKSTSRGRVVMAVWPLCVHVASHYQGG